MANQWIQEQIGILVQLIQAIRFTTHQLIKKGERMKKVSVNWNAIVSDNKDSLADFAENVVSIRTLNSELSTPAARREVRKLERLIGVEKARPMARMALRRRGYQFN